MMNPPIKGDKKIIHAWAMYDWANSAHSLVITSTVFPVYYAAVTGSDDGASVDFFGWSVNASSLFSYAIAAAYLLVALLSPPFASVADYTGTKKGFMRAFCYLGCAACAALFFFNGENVEWGIIMFALSVYGFAGSLVYYNAFLPEIAEQKDQDRVSAKGFALGYIGSVILQVALFVVLLKKEWFGISDEKLPAKISFLVVGIWWFVFATYSLKYLPENVFNRKPSGRIFLNGYKELMKVQRQIRAYPRLLTFLFAFFFYIMATETVMFLAALFGSKELKLEAHQLIITVLIIQLVAIGGAYLFAQISRRIGNISSIAISIFIWIGICIAAYFVKTALQFYAVAFAVGMVMGGIQSLSRSTYSKMLPETEDTASFFSFYDVANKLALVIGTTTFGIIVQRYGNMRKPIIALIAFFVVGLILLMVLRRQLKKDVKLTMVNPKGH